MMNDLIAVKKLAEWERLKALVLDSVSSPITRRLYNMALNEFMNWYSQAPRPAFSKATVSAWRASLETRGLGSSSIIIRMSAIRKLAGETVDNGLLAPELTAGISRVKSVKSIGVRTGNWLSLRQAQALLSAPDSTTAKGLRDRAILAVLLGCGLRRSEVAALTFKHIQQRDGRWCIVDLKGKHGRIRTAPVPAWVKLAIDSWLSAAAVEDGHIFRPVNRAELPTGARLGEKVVWQMLQQYAEAVGVPGIAPHDLRRTCAKLCRAAGGELEQIGSRPLLPRPMLRVVQRCSLGHGYHFLCVEFVLCFKLQEVGLELVGHGVGVDARDVAVVLKFNRSSADRSCAASR
jgi:integrase